MCDMGGPGGGGVTIVIVAPKGAGLGGPPMPPGKGIGGPKDMGSPIDLGGGMDPEDMKDLGADEDKEMSPGGKDMMAPARPMALRSMGGPKKIAPKPRGL